MRRLSNEEKIKRLDEYNAKNEIKIKKKDEKVLINITKTFIKAVNYYNKLNLISNKKTLCKI